ncbi:MAG: MerR family transcriptional regulator [Akkermansiaceae bacterium]|nr:MerR family transcriptional regulator [Akkermansiaceae bacterium]MCF7734646.1 MerR family transcriptional regulator [Akkermansiaceae bacterium]
MSEAHHPIQLVSRLTGLSMHVIRIWEQRYNAVEPQRTPTNRRIYTQSDVERLNLLREVTQAGYKVSQVAQLPMEKLRQLAAESAAGDRRAFPPVTEAPAPASLLDDCVVAIKALDANALEVILKRAATVLGALGLLQRVIAPLSQALGEMWRDGTITTAHEHFATAVIRTVLGNATKAFGVPAHAPLLLVATPAGQVHELGALLVAATAVNFGWRVTYLGANLPAAELAGAAQLSQARAVALSLVYPEDDPQLEGELERLCDALPPETALLVGGRAMPAYRDTLEQAGAIPVENLAHLGATLDGLRTSRQPTHRKARR